MGKAIREIMTSNPVCVDTTTSVFDCAKEMKDHDIGDLIVTENGNICGIVTDRDIVVRAVSEGKDPKNVKVGEICSKNVTKVSPNDTVDRAVELMREKAVRRLPVTDGGKPVGVVSLGDLALTKDPSSALGEISKAQPNR